MPLHALRKAGSFGAHPPKDGATLVYELSRDDLEACSAILELRFQSNTCCRPSVLR